MVGVETIALLRSDQHRQPRGFIWLLSYPLVNAEKDKIS